MFEQISMFEMIDTDSMLPPDRQRFRRALRTGSGFEHGKERIKEHSFLPKKQFAEYLKHEYGIGGSSFEDGWIGSTSMWFYICDKGWENRKEYSWLVVADEIKDMIKTNSY